MTPIFNLGYPPPLKGAPRGGWGASGGIPPKIMCYVNSGVLKSGEFKNDLHFQFRVPPTPLKGAPGGDGGLEGVYHQKSCVISILGFSTVGNAK